MNPAPKQKQRIIGYVRVSTEEQKKEGHSIEAQRERIEKYVGAYPEYQLVNIEEDDASGKDMHRRPGLQRCLRMMDRKEVEGIIVTHTDRLTRSNTDLCYLTDRYFGEGKNFNLIAIEQHVDLRTAGGRLVQGILTMFAQHERERIGERVRATHAYLKGQGFYIGGETPYGYRPEKLQPGEDRPRRVVIDEYEQKVLGLMRSWRKRGASLRDIVNMLDDEGYVNRRGGRFSPGQVNALCSRDDETVLLGDTSIPRGNGDAERRAESM